MTYPSIVSQQSSSRLRSGGCLVLVCFIPALVLGALATAATIETVPVRGVAALNQPVAVYNNWSAYDELSDNIVLTEELAMKQLQEILRLRRAGVRIDYYMMDAFWYAPKGGYREFRRPHWPNGPDRWLDACKTNGLKPGLWVASNQLSFMEPIAEWQTSLDPKANALCLFEGGFLPHFMETLQFWYDRGVRMFKFDFANFGAATPDAAKRMSPEAIIVQNSEALRRALVEFRKRNPEVLLAAFNGYGGDVEGTFAPIRQTVDLRWLLAFDTLYCGDPRPADVPAMNFWRAQDLYTDHMVRYYEANGVPLERIDNTGFMVGTTGTCYGRRTAAWKGMLLLEHARGGWMNVYYGNLELIDAEKARWFAKAQRPYFALQSFGRTYSFGGLPGREEPYGFCSVDAGGSLYTVVNPSQSRRQVKLPKALRLQGRLANGRVQFRDAGFVPTLSVDEVTLGPEQMALVGYGEYAKAKYDLGVEEDVVIPQSICPLEVAFRDDGTNAVAGSVTVPDKEDLRIILRWFGDGKPWRVSGGAPPKGTSLGRIARIQIEQDGQPIPLTINYDKAIWSGLSWAVGEVKARHLKPGAPITVRCVLGQTKPAQLRAAVYAVNYR
jgi:hypothetical protein